MLYVQDVAQSHGLHSKAEAALHFSQLLGPGARLVLAWGERGAAAWSCTTGLLECPAYPPPGHLYTATSGGPGHVLGGGGEVQPGLRGLHSPRRCGLHIKGDMTPPVHMLSGVSL